MEAIDVRGRFVWHQLMTRDVPAAKRFYSNLIGWKPQSWPLDPTYTVCHSDQGPMAGIMPIPADIPAEVPPHWLGYVGTRDVDGTAVATVRAGGSILKEPADLSGAGRYAVLKDPQGAVFAILDPENSRPEPQGMPLAGSFSWHELATSDAEAAFSFYSDLFGWDALVRMPLAGGETYLIFGNNGIQRGGIYLKPADLPGPPSWLHYAQVNDTDAGWRNAEGGGAKLVAGPMDVPGGSRVVTFFDPTGAAFAVVSTPASAQPMEAKPAAKPKAKGRAKRKAKVKTKAKAKATTKPKAKSKAKAAPKKKKVAKKAVAKRRKPASKKKPSKKKVVMKKTKSTRRKK
ncbi:MAG: VOC family protein [Steroidobacteraceae bacterium]|nr:VOC family protein [Steroidobacteraceae bacterium]